MFDLFYYGVMLLVVLWIFYKCAVNCIKVDREISVKRIKFEEFKKELQNKNTKYVYNSMIEIKDKDPALYEAMCFYLGQTIIESYQNGNLSKYIS